MRAIERFAVARVWGTVSEAVHARATTREESQASGGFGGLATGLIPREIWAWSLLCLRY